MKQFLLAFLLAFVLLLGGRTTSMADDFNVNVNINEYYEISIEGIFLVNFNNGHYWVYGFSKPTQGDIYFNNTGAPGDVTYSTDYSNISYEGYPGDKIYFKSSQTGLCKFSVFIRDYDTGYTATKTFTINGSPTVTTTAAASIAANSATLGGNVTADGGATVTERGVVYSLASANTNPQIGGTGVTKVAYSSGGTGSFSQSVGSLTSGSQYYVNAYATNSAGTGYGTATSFTTTGAAVAPTATTNAASSVTAAGATLNGSINANGTSTTVTFEYGTSNSYGTSVSATPATVTGSSATSVSYSLTGLTAGTTYHYRVKGVNTAGTGYGNNATFTTPNTHPMPLVNGRNANFVIGQQDFVSNSVNSSTNGSGLNGPYPMAIDEAHGKLYVSDNANNRVLRYAWPITSNQPTPDLVFGQTSINSIVVPSTATGSANICYMPMGLAVDPYGNLWVCNTGYNRIIRFSAAYSISSDNPNADKVLGQPNYTDIGSSGEAAQNTLHQPTGICFDGLGNLWVADNNGYRVVCFYDANNK